MSPDSFLPAAVGICTDIAETMSCGELVLSAVSVLSVIKQIYDKMVLPI